MGRLVVILGLLLILGGIATLVLGALGVPDAFTRTHHVMMLCIGISGMTVGALLLWARYFALD